jgi:hypothetical protein
LVRFLRKTTKRKFQKIRRSWKIRKMIKRKIMRSRGSRRNKKTTQGKIKRAGGADASGRPPRGISRTRTGTLKFEEGFRLKRIGRFWFQSQSLRFAFLLSSLNAKCLGILVQIRKSDSQNLGKCANL